MLGANGDFASFNLFAYCGSNPVSRADSNGEFWHLVIGATVGAAIGAVSSVISQATTQLAQGKSLNEIDINATNVLISAGAGAATGFLAATGAGILTQVVGNTAASALSNTLTQVNDIKRGAQEAWSWSSFTLDTLTGAVAGLWGGRGASYGNSKGITQAGKQFTKRVCSNIDELTKAAAYYMKTAHQTGGANVFTELSKSLGKSFVVTTGNSAVRAFVELRVY